MQAMPAALQQRRKLFGTLLPVAVQRIPSALKAGVGSVRQERLSWLLLSGAAAAYDRRRGRAAQGRLQRWRAKIDAALQCGIVRALEASRFGLPGEAPTRRQR